MRTDRTDPTSPIRVLFMQSQTFYGADSRIHGLIMRSMDRRQVEIHAACNYGLNHKKSASAAELEKIEDLRLRRTHFGVSTYELSRVEKIKQVPRQTLPAAVSLAGLAGYIRRNRIEIIHGTEKPRDAFIGFLLSRLSGAKCVVHLHVKAERWISRNVQWAMNHADGLIGVSHFVADSMAAMGFPPERIHVVHNSIDLTEWDPTVDGTPVREEFGLSPDTPLLLVASRLFYWKGHSELLQALARVRPHVRDFRLLVVGEDDPRAHPGRGRYSDELKAQAEVLGLTDRVIFTGFRTDTARLFAACDLYTMPSFEEPFGMVFLEAMAMKKPVVALDNGGSREIVERGVSGLLSQPQDIDGLAANIRTLIENRPLRVQLGECGRKRVEEYFTPDRLSVDVLNVYRKVLGR